MKRKLLLIAVTIVLLVMIGSASASQPLVYPGPEPTIPFGAYVNQYYSVTFDGEGEAIISLKLIIQNNDVELLDKISLGIPGNIEFLGAMEKTTAQGTSTCTNYENQCVEYGQGSTCIQYDYNGNCLKQETPCLRYGQVCTKYATTNSYRTAFRRMNIEAEQLAQSTVLPLSFAAPLTTGGQSEILLMYKAYDYANKGLGTFRFEFETAKVPIMTNNMRVATNVQSDLIMKGTTAKVNYQSAFAMGSTFKTTSVVSESLSNDIASYGRGIQYAPGNVKVTSFLDPHESFTVKGAYGKSWFALYWTTMLWIVLVILAIILFIVHGVKKLFLFAGNNIPEKQKKIHAESKHTFVLPFVGGLLTAISIGVIWGITILLTSLIGNAMSYSNKSIFAFIFILFAIFISLALMIGIPIYMGSKYGAATGVFTMLSMFGWMFVFAIIIFIFISILTAPTILRAI